jgi:hypothetical protein
MAHLRHDINSSTVVVCRVDAGSQRICAGKPVGDHRIESCLEHLLADEGVGVGNIRHLKIGNQGKTKVYELTCDREARREHQWIANLDAV